MSIQGLQRLEVWQRAKDFALRIYRRFTALASAGRKVDLNSQIRRSSLSISANIAEGYGRFYYQENVRFCYNARGSLEETLSHLVFAFEAKYIPKTLFKELSTEGDEIDRMLNGYIAYLKRASRERTNPALPCAIHELSGPYSVRDLRRNLISDSLTLCSLSI